MPTSQWHRYYTAQVAAPPHVLFEVLSDLPNYARWLPNSEAYKTTTDVEPYPVQIGSRYHDGRPDEPGKGWWGTVTGFQPPGSLDFLHVITVKQVRAKVDVNIHYSFELEGGGSHVTRWLILDIEMPALVRPLRGFITSSFDKENIRTMAAVKAFAESHSDGIPDD